MYNRGKRRSEGKLNAWGRKGWTRPGSEDPPNGFPLRSWLLVAARRLAQTRISAGEFLIFTVGLLSVSQRLDLVEYVYAKLKTKHQKEYFLRQSEAKRYSGLGSRIKDDLDYERGSRTESEILIYVRRLIEREARLSHAARNCKNYRGLAPLQALLGLDRHDLLILAAAYAHARHEKFKELCNSGDEITFARIIGVAVDLPMEEVQAKLMKGAPLVSCGALEELQPHSSRPIKLAAAIQFQLSGLNSESFTAQFCRKDSGRRYALGGFSVERTAVDVLRRILSGTGGCNVLLHGVAGTGKTEFARAIARESGKDCYFLQHGEGDETDLNARRMALHVVARSLPREKAVLVIDEADAMINTRLSLFAQRDTLEKGWLNRFLETSPIKIVWITNEAGHMEESLRRRFAFNIEFKRFTRSQRENTWREVLKDRSHQRTAKVLGPEDLRRLSEKYALSAGGIAASVQALNSMVADGKSAPELMKRDLELLLERHVALSDNPKRPPLALPAKEYDLSALEIDADPKAIVSAVGALGALSVGAGTKIRHAHSAQPDGAINLLFWGLPGTGKTEFAKHIAAETGMELIVRRASDLLSMWVGGTEKAIQEAFDEASREKAILFIDEADSFFTDRADAMRSYEVTRTNELLVQMENHKGVLICCTNLLDNLDPAAMRRFQWKVEFKPLSARGRAILLQKYFGIAIESLSQEERRRLEAMEGLTAGDVRAVFNRGRRLASSRAGAGDILKNMESEVAYRNGEGYKGRAGF